MASDDEDLVRRREAGRWLRAARERRGFPTGEALARRMGVTASVISRYETGASRISDERAEQIAGALNMNIIDVRRGLGLWVPREADRPRTTADEVRDSVLAPETKEALLSIEENLRRWKVMRDERRIRRAQRLLEVVEDDQDTA